MIQNINKIFTDYLNIILNNINSFLSPTQLIIICVLLIYIMNRALQYSLNSNDNPNPNMTKFIAHSLQYWSWILIIIIIFPKILSLLYH